MTSHSKFISFGEMEGDELKPPSVLSKLFTKIKINWPNSSQPDLSAQQSQILPIQTSQSTTSKSTSPELPETLLSPNSEKTFYGNHKKRPNSLTLLDPGHSSPSVSSSQLFTGDLIPPHPSSPGKMGIEINTQFTSEDDSSSFHSSSVSHKNALFMQGNNSSTAILNSRPSEAITGILKRLRGEGINKDYWMKDENCKECYECKLPFNTFRRKHHCRICGQIFCNSCASHMIPGDKLGHPGLIRVCTHCNNLVKAHEQYPETFGVDRSGDHSDQLTPSSNKKFSYGRDRKPSDTSPNMLSKSSPHSKEGFKQMLISGTRTANPSNHRRETSAPFRNAAKPYATNNFTDNENVLDLDTNIVLVNVQSDEEDNAGIDIPSSPNNDFTMMSGYIESISNELEKKNPTNLLNVQRPVNDTLVKRSFTIPSLVSPEVSRFAHLQDSSQACDIEDIEISSPSLISGPLIQHSYLNAASYQHLNRLISQCLKQFKIHEPEVWQPILRDLALKAAFNIELDIRRGDSLDIRHYVKVKKIPGGTPSMSEYIDGVVCTKNLAHKMMPRKISNPRILILNFPFEYQRVEYQFLSIESVLASEQEHLKNMVARVLSLRPTLVIVEKNISRIALDLLLKANLSVATNVKPSIIYAIARCTQAQVLTSLDQIVFDPKLGECDYFEVRTYAHELIPMWKKSYLFFSGCNNRLGCSLVLRGGDLALLGKMKKILEFSVYTAYHLKLENVLMRDQFVKNPDVSQEFNLIDEFVSMPQSPDIHFNESISNNNNISLVDKNIDILLDLYKHRLLSTSPMVKFPPPYLLIQVKNEKDSLTKLKTQYNNMVTSQNTDNLESPRLLDGLTFQKNQLEIELSLQKSHLTLLEEHYDQMKSSELLMKAMEFPISPFSHQSITILYCNVFVSENLICQAPQKHTIDYYQESDMSLGQFLEELCFDTSVICGTCDQSFFSHLRSYVHGDARMTITVQQLACPLPGMEDTILMWNYCLVCQKSLLVVPMSQETYKYSFGKYLELMFYHAPSTCRADLCPHDIHKDHVRYFGHRNLAARFQYEKIDLLDVNVPPTKLNFKPSISTKLKNEDYEKLKASINSYWDSVNEKLKSLMVYSMSIEKHDTCREELLEMARRVGAERTYILQVLEQTFLNSHPTDTLALNLVLRVMQEKVAEWDGEFADIIDKYLQTEKDLRRLTAVQIRKLFPDKDEAPAPIPDDLSVNAEEVQEVSEDEPIQYQEPSALGPIYPTLGGSPTGTPTDELPINPLEISLDHTFGNLYQPVMDGRTYRRYSLKHMQDDNNTHNQESSKETLKPSDNLITPQKIDEKEQHDFHMYKPHLKNSDLPKVVSTIKSSGTPFHSKTDSNSSTYLPLTNKFSDKSKDYSSLRRSNTTAVPLFSPVLTPKQLVIKQPTIGEGTIGSNTAKRMAARAASKGPLDKPLLKADKNIKLKYNLRSAEDRMSDSHRYAFQDTNERSTYSKDSVNSVDRRIKRSQTSATPAGRINRPRAMTRPVIEVYSNPQDAVKDESDDEFSEPGSQNTSINYKQPKPAASANNLRATPNHRMHQTRTGPRIDINRNVKSSPHIPQLTPNTKIGSPEVLSESPGAYVSNSILTFLNNDMDMLPSPPKSPGKAEMPVMSSEDPFIKANSNINLNVPGIEIQNQDQADQTIESPEKLSIIKTFSNLWNIPTSPHVVPLEYPLQPTEHLFPDSLIVIREDEPSSVIAFTLSSQTYHDQLRFIRQNQYRSTESIDDSEEFSYDIESTLKQKTSTHLKYQLAEGAIKFSCKIFFAEQFDALRHYCDQDIMFIESLARCVKWQASGGKSGSIFLKTRDNRLIMKEVSRAELDAFLKFAPVYFSYLAQGFFEELPMMLAKIFGVYRIGFKNIVTGKTVKLDVLIMENLFYERKISRIFDLKGSMRNRHVQSTGKENEVLLDENLMEIICRNPIFIRAHAKRLLHLAIHNDTLFLSKLNVMDYSLLVGIDEEQGELVVGIVDFIRTFTWDKKLESWVKESGFLGGGGEKPTILSPSNYKHRFRSFMEKYFLMVPDKYFLPGLDRKLK